MTANQVMKQLEDMHITHNINVSKLSTNLYGRWYERKGGGEPRMIVGYNRNELYNIGLQVMWRDRFGDGICSWTTFKNQFMTNIDLSSK